jgi:hypothetical protein
VTSPTGFEPALPLGNSRCADFWETSANETVCHYSAALDRFEAAQDDYIIAHPFRAVADALINARQEAMTGLPGRALEPVDDLSVRSSPHHRACARGGT